MSFPLISFPALILQNNDNKLFQTVFGVFFMTVVFAFLVHRHRGNVENIRKGR